MTLARFYDEAPLHSLRRRRSWGRACRVVEGAAGVDQSVVVCEVVDQHAVVVQISSYRSRNRRQQCTVFPEVVPIADSRNSPNLLVTVQKLQ